MQFAVHFYPELLNEWNKIVENATRKKSDFFNAVMLPLSRCHYEVTRKSENIKGGEGEWIGGGGAKSYYAPKTSFMYGRLLALRLPEAPLSFAFNVV